MGDRTEYRGEYTPPRITYDGGVSTVRISSKDLPSKPRGKDIYHIIASSTIPPVLPEQSEPVPPLIKATVSDGPVSGSVRVSTLERPTGVSRPSTFQPPLKKPSPQSDGVGATSGVSSTSVENVYTPPLNKTDSLRSPLPNGASPAPPPPPPPPPLPDLNSSKDINDNLVKNKIKDNQNITKLPVVLENHPPLVQSSPGESNSPLERQNPNGRATVPAPKALRSSRDDLRVRKERKVSWNEEVVVTREGTDAVYTSGLQPEDHEYSPCDGGKPAKGNNSLNGNIHTHTGLDGQEEALKDYGLLDEPVFTYEGRSRGSKIFIVTMFVLLICVTLVAVIMGVLYGISITTNWNDQINSLRDTLSLQEPAPGTAPFPSSWWSQPNNGTFIYLVLAGETMTGQQPSTPALLSWIKGQKIRVTMSDGMGTFQRVSLGDPLVDRTNQLTLMLTNTMWYDAEVKTGDHYSLVSITAASGLDISWST